MHPDTIKEASPAHESERGGFLHIYLLSCLQFFLFQMLQDALALWS